MVLLTTRYSESVSGKARGMFRGPFSFDLHFEGAMTFSAFTFEPIPIISSSSEVAAFSIIGTSTYRRWTAT